MDIKSIKALADKHGDFYMYYRKQVGQGSTYLGGTLDFDNKYIQARHASGDAGIPASLPLKEAAKRAQRAGNVLVFSWTNDKFRTIKAKDVRRMTRLCPEPMNGRNN